MVRARRGGAAAALCATLAGCVSQTQLTKVETAAASFHARQRGGEDAANYTAANDAFHGRVSASAFATTQAAVRALTECSVPIRDATDAGRCFSVDLGNVSHNDATLFKATH